MCANFLTHKLTAEISAQLSLLLPTFEEAEFREVFPNQKAPVIYCQNGQNQYLPANFGLLNWWDKDYSKSSYTTYNARQETVSTKPSFRNEWHNNQFCLVPTGMIFEPYYPEGSTKSVRYGISLKTDEPFMVAGLWNEFQDDRGMPVRSFTMLTVDASHNPFMCHFHRPDKQKRSIVVVPPEHYDHWLHAHHQDVPELISDITAERFKAQPKPVIR